MGDAIIVNKDTVRALRQKLGNPARLAEVTETARKMLDIKKTLLWRADHGTCCGSLCNIASNLTQEATMLENALAFLEKGDKVGAGRVLEDYEQMLVSKSSCDTGKPGNCH